MDLLAKRNAAAAKKEKPLNPQEGNWGPRNLVPQLEGSIAALRQHPKGINPSKPINEASTGLNSRPAFYCLPQGAAQYSISPKTQGRAGDGKTRNSLRPD